MRDLYKRLGISPNDSVDKIRAALPRCPDEAVRRDAERVLLDPQSREVYDRNLLLLRQIARARESLGVHRTSNWDAGMRLEFGGTAAPQATTTKKGSGGGCGWMLLLVIAALFFGFLAYDNSEAVLHERAVKADTINAYKHFLGKKPDSDFADRVQERIRELELEGKWGGTSARMEALGEVIDPTSNTQVQLFELAAEVVTEIPESEAGLEAAGFLREARSKFEGQLANAETAIHFYRLFPDQAAAELMVGRLEAMVASSNRAEDFQSILTFFKEVDHLPGVSVVRIGPLRQRAADRLAAKYRDFSFVRSIDTKEAYELYLKQIPSGSYADIARRRIVDLEVDEILKGEVGELPELQPLGNSKSSTLASVEVSNDTSYNLTVRYSGTDSQKHVISPRQKKTFQIRKGDYRVTATVDAGSVRPYAGNETINYDRYGVSFYIITTRF